MLAVNLNRNTLLLLTSETIESMVLFVNGDTENYSSFLNTATCLLSVSLKTRILSFKKFTVILVAPHRKPRVGKFWLLSSTSAVMPSEVWNTENYIPVCHAKKATFEPSTYTFKPFVAAPSLVDCHSNRNRPFDIFLLMRDTECYSTNLHT